MNCIPKSLPLSKSERLGRKITLFTQFPSQEKDLYNMFWVCFTLFWIFLHAHFIKVMMKTKCLCDFFPLGQKNIFSCVLCISIVTFNYFHSKPSLSSTENWTQQKPFSKGSHLEFWGTKVCLAQWILHLLRTVINNFKIFQCDRMELQIRSSWNYSSLA